MAHCAEFTSELCAETWVVKDGTVTALLKGVKLEGQGEAHSAAVAAELEAALKLKAQVPNPPTSPSLPLRPSARRPHP